MVYIDNQACRVVIQPLTIIQHNQPHNIAMVDGTHQGYPKKAMLKVYTACVSNP